MAIETSNTLEKHFQDQIKNNNRNTRRQKKEEVHERKRTEQRKKEEEEREKEVQEERERLERIERERAERIERERVERIEREREERVEREKVEELRKKEEDKLADEREQRRLARELRDRRAHEEEERATRRLAQEAGLARIQEEEEARATKPVKQHSVQGGRRGGGEEQRQVGKEKPVQEEEADVQIEFQEFDPEDSLKRSGLAGKSFPKEEQPRTRVSSSNNKHNNLFLEKFNLSRSEGNISRSFSDTFTKKAFNNTDATVSRDKSDRIVGIKKRLEESRDTVAVTEQLSPGLRRPSVEAASPANTRSAKDRDRSVDVYHETVRQRTTKDKQVISPDFFKASTPPNREAPTDGGGKQRQSVGSGGRNHSSSSNQKPTSTLARAATMKEPRRMEEGSAAEPGLPSVRRLLARFEPGHAASSAAASAEHRPSRFSKEERIIKRGMSMDNIAAASSGECILTDFPPATPVNRRPAPTAPPNVYRSSCGDDAVQPVVMKSTEAWNPRKFIKGLYNLPAVQDHQTAAEHAEAGPISLDGSSNCPSIEGYMEKLPAGRKRPTLWNSWKKHYFVARSGVLHIYTNKAQTELIEKLELFGGQIDFMDSNMLGVEDRRGQYVVVRCATHQAAQEWESALSFHTLENYAKTFVSPLPLPREIRSMSSIIVVDLGGASIRAGFAGPSPYLPSVFFPSLMAVSSTNNHEKYFGFDALKPDIRGRCKLSSPLLPSRSIDKYCVDLVALCGLLLKVFQELRADPKKCELQLSVPRSFNDKTKVAIAALLFDEFEVRSVNLGHQSVFTLHSYNTDTGVVVDIGERMDIVPIVAGYKVQSGLSRAATGGMELCGHMRHALLGRNYSLTDFLDVFVVRQVAERLCYLARNFDSEVENYAGEEKTVGLGEGSKVSAVTLGTERFQITEGLFKPEMWGLDQAGVHVLVKKAITECSLDVRKEMAQSVFLSGGLTLIPGFKHRLETELSRILASRPRVHASPYRYHAAFLGASAHATSPAYQATKITRAQWIKGNADVASTWVL